MAISNETIHDLPPAAWLAQAAQVHGEEPALIHGSRRLSFRALDEASLALAARLSQQTCGAVVGVDAGDPWLLALTLHATLRLGLALLPLERSMLLPRRNRLLQQSGCRMVLAEARPARLPEAVDWRSSQVLVETATVLPRPTFNDDPDAILLIVPTSGTRGEPKGVMLSARNLAAGVGAASRALDLQGGDCWLGCLPLNHIGGLAILLRCLRQGASVALQDGFDAQLVWDALKRHQITHLSLVPPMLQRLLELSAGESAPASLKVVLLGGAALDPELAGRAHAAGWPLAVSYGMSETASLCAIERGQQAGLVAGRVGRPLEGFQTVCSKDGRLRIRGGAVMAGYANPQLTPGDGIREGWFESGDLGGMDDSGNLTITGRADELLNAGGRLIHPREVEPLIKACPGVTGVAVTSQTDPVWGDRLIAVYTGTISEADLLEWTGDHLPRVLRPRSCMQLDRLPHNAMGKLDRKILNRLLCLHTP